jgi:hypothetical protein
MRTTADHMMTIFLINFALSYVRKRSLPVAALSVAWFSGRSLAGIVGSNPARGMDMCLS